MKNPMQQLAEKIKTRNAERMEEEKRRSLECDLVAAGAELAEYAGLTNDQKMELLHYLRKPEVVLRGYP